jgi:ferredoxin
MAGRPRAGPLAKALSLSGLVLLAWGWWANRAVFTVGSQEVWLADLVPLALIVPFGLWRLLTEREPYQRVRIRAILALYLSLWVALPLLFGVRVPRLGGAPEPFPAIHVVGSLAFFVYGAAMLFFGKRLDCGWNCPCVTTRETVAYAFREATPRGRLWWQLRWLKWLPGGLLVAYLVLLVVRPQIAYEVAGRPLYGYMAGTYFYSFLFVPLLGNRGYCRWLCPFAAFWGWLSYLGMYRIKARSDGCRGCRACEAACDMGVPIAELVASRGEVRTVECMGCGRCVSACPHGVLRIESAAKWWLGEPRQPAGSAASPRPAGRRTAAR